MFFFFKQKTAYEMRISDWSSDVCSSDLDMDALVSTDWLERELGASDLRVVDATKFLGADRDARAEYEAGHIPGAVFMDLAELTDASNAVENKIGRASCRERVCQYV